MESLSWKNVLIKFQKALFHLFYSKFSETFFPNFLAFQNQFAKFRIQSTYKKAWWYWALWKFQNLFSEFGFFSPRSWKFNLMWREIPPVEKTSREHFCEVHEDKKIFTRECLLLIPMISLKNSKRGSDFTCHQYQTYACRNLSHHLVRSESNLPLLIPNLIFYH